MTRPAPLRLVLLIALLCAVSLRLLTPPGWMPNIDGRAGGPLVICTADGTHAVPPADHGPHAPAKTAHAVCAFAGLALGARPDPAAVAPPLAAPLAAAAPRLGHQVRLAPAWRRPQAPRAPPLRA